MIMRITLPILEDTRAFCVAADLTGNGRLSKIAFCLSSDNNLITHELYKQLPHEDLSFPKIVTKDPVVPYEIIDDLSFSLIGAKYGRIKELNLGGQILRDIYVIIPCDSIPSDKDILLGHSTIFSFGSFVIDNEKSMAILTDEKIEPSERYEVISSTKPERSSIEHFTLPENTDEILASIEKKHRHNGARIFDRRSKLINDPIRVIYGYQPRYFYDKIRAFLKMSNGICLPKIYDRERPFVMMSHQGPLFTFANVIEVNHCYPYINPDDDYLMVTNGEQTIFAYSSGRVFSMNAYSRATDGYLAMPGHLLRK